MHHLLSTLSFHPVIIEAVANLSFDRSESVFNDLDAYNNLSPLERFEASYQSLPFLLASYRQLNIEEQIIHDTLQDLNYRTMKYYKQHQALGLDAKDSKWLNLLFQAQIFKIGSLRFQKFPLDYQEIEREGIDAMPLDDSIKKRFPENTPMINVHIETATDFSQTAVTHAFQKAQSFFEKTFPDYQAQYFICRTWLLHPSINRLLKENSNIFQFKERFKIIATSPNYTQALQRIYGTDNLDQIALQDKKTSLQKQAFVNYQSLGVACGVIKIEREP